MSTLKIASLVFVGPFDRYGYQYIYKTVLANLYAFSTRVYICSSSRNRIGVDDILAQFPDLEYISDVTTWLPVDEQGNEVFRLEKLVANCNKVLDMARSDGFDCAAIFAINQYLPEYNQSHFLTECERMLTEGEPFCWMYKRIQLANRLLETDRRLPWIINLHYPDPVLIEADAIRLPVSGGYYRSMLGDFRDKSNISTVDVPREMTVRDLEEMRCFIRNYDEINPGVDPTFIWERDKSMEIAKYSVKRFSNDPLSPTGQLIASYSRPDFISQYLLSVHPDNAPWHVKIGRSIKSRVEALPLFHYLKHK